MGQKMHTVYLSLGGNLGDPAETLQRCITSFRNWPSCSQVETARLFKTTPVDMVPGSQLFVNTAVRLETPLTPQDFKAHCQLLERDLGKWEKPKNASRPIDIDIITFGKEWVDDKDLHIPHPRWLDRLFVLVPLRELTERIWVATGPEQGDWLDLEKIIATHPNPHQEQITCLDSGELIVERLLGV